MRKLCVRFTIPQLVFVSMYKMKLEDLRQALPMAVSLILLTVAFYALGWAVSRRMNGKERRSATHAAITFGNYGWIGWAAAQVFFGLHGFQRAVFFTMLWWPVFYGFGLSIGIMHHGKQEGERQWLYVLKMAAPALVAIGLGIGLNLLNVKVDGNFVYDTVQKFGEMSIPLILLSVGVQLEFRNITRQVAPACTVTAMRLLVGPALGVLVFFIVRATVGCDDVSAKVILLQSTMPVATMTPALGENFDMDLNVAGGAIVLSTLLSLLTVPLWLGFLVPALGL